MNLEVLCEKPDKREDKTSEACFSGQKNSSSFWNWDNNRIEEAMGKLARELHLQEQNY